MPKIDLSKLNIRVVAKEDTESIVEIDERVSGKRRFEYFKRKCDSCLHGSYMLAASLVAEYEQKVIGFVMGNVYLGEFGIPESTASLDSVGVDPDFQGQGVGAALMKAFISELKKDHIVNIHTVVDWNDWKLMKFFEKSGFVPSKSVKLELKVSS